MFLQADKNKNGRIDFDEFVDMMLPGQATIFTLYTTFFLSLETSLTKL